MTIDNEAMLEYFEKFDTVKHKYLQNGIDKVEDELLEELREIAYRENEIRGWDSQEAVDTYRTLNKVYNFTLEDDYKYCNLLQHIIEEMLGRYVGIEGIADLFKPSFFYFEWMMHLEYMEQKHSYSYYRDHYLHQIRNLYEMFVLLDDCGMWKSCMQIYKERNDTVAKRIHKCVQEQVDWMRVEDRKILEEVCSKIKKKDEDVFGIEEMIYRELLFSVAIVSALVHDIGYPICYMKRTYGKMLHFLPLASVFMSIEDTIPRANMLLKNSLLYEVVGSAEIERRINADDHGTYSAIILLMQYYDNGHIHKLSPIKRMVIELSALVIYNHTLHYHFQRGKRERYNNVYIENPLSYLFRLCDDLQEWERTYFEINDGGNLFICSKCKSPMIKNLQRDSNVEQGESPYACMCGKTGINTNLFPYRKMMNVAPFNLLQIEYAKGSKVMSIKMHCDLAKLLQVARYNPVFAVQRIAGIGEIKDMVDAQMQLPAIFIDTYVSNNPIGIKTEILANFLKANKIFAEIVEACSDIECDCAIPLNKYSELSIKKWEKFLEEVALKDEVAEFVLKGGRSYFSAKNSDIVKESIIFYTFLIIVGEKLRKVRELIFTEEVENSYRGEKQKEKLAVDLYKYFEKISCAVAEKFKIRDKVCEALISDCLQQMFCKVNKKEFEQKRYSMLYRQYLLLREDMPELVQTYVDNEMYKEKCNNYKNKKKSEGMFDFYSDYYFFFEIAKK